MSVPAAGLPARLGALAAFLVPGAALWLPSGYSVGASLLLVASLLGVYAWRECCMPPVLRWWFATVVCMGLVWALDIDTARGWTSADRSVKYLLVLPCIVHVCIWPPRPAVLRWGLVVGAVGAGAIALVQSIMQQRVRVEGFTNAIQFGDLAMLLACMCALWLATGREHLGRAARWSLAFAALLALIASVLSLSRGGWLAFGLSLPLWLWLLARRRNHRLALSAAAWLCAAGLLVGLYQGPEVAQRWRTGVHEGSAYREGVTETIITSSGQRLEQWRLALAMGSDKPWLGWRSGYGAEKERRVHAGEADASVLNLGHAHNELLDMFAKRGLLGVVALLLFYLVPAIAFWPTGRRVGAAPGQAADGTALALCLVGLALPVLYAGFGLTQVFFAHNSGNVFYLLMVTLVLAALQAHLTGCAAAPPATRAR